MIFKGAKFIFIAIFCGVLLFGMLSCKKQWKETTPLSISYIFTKPTSTLQGLVINSVTFNLDKLTFSGKRKEGGDVSFESSPSPSQITVTTGGSGTLGYQLPQGDYTQMNLALDYNRSDTNAIFTINATFTDTTDHTTIPVIIRIDSRVFTSSAVKNSSGGSEIIVTTSNSIHSKITINPSYWLSSIDTKIFSIAQYDIVNNSRVLNINKNENAELYQFIVSRLSVPPDITIQ